MNQQRKNLILYILLGLLTTIFCIKQIGEPDVWWQIKTGQFILENGYVPKVDVFSYTNEEAPWINVKWGTEVLMAAISNNFGPEWLMLLTWILLAGIVYFSLRSYKNLFRILREERSPDFSLPIIPFFMMLAGMAFRLNGRPEMVSYFFTSVFIFLFIRFRTKPDKLIWLLVPLQCLWANMHEAYGVGMVMLTLFSLDILYLTYKSRLENKHRNQVLIVSLLAILATGIHPFGVQMIPHPLEIFGQLGANKFTSELLSFTSTSYWTLPAWMLILSVIFLVVGFIRFKKANILNKVPLAIMVLILAFLYLSLKAQRNIPLFLTSIIPVLACLFSLLKFRKWAFATSLTVGVLLYVAVGSGKFYNKLLPREAYGLRIDPGRNVVGGANYIKQHSPHQKGFVDYLSSSYFLWALDDFKTFIDLRDLDVFSEDFMRNVLMLYQFPDNPVNGKPIWDLVAEDDGFTYVGLLNREDFFPLHRYLNQSEKWELVYLDPNISIYLKTVAENAADISAIRNTTFEERFHPYGVLPASAGAKLVSKIFWPFYEEKNVEGLNYLNTIERLKTGLGFRE